MSEKIKEILKKVVLDFGNVDPKILTGDLENVEELKRALDSFYCQVIRSLLPGNDGKAYDFFKNYTFPSSFLEISLDEDESIFIRPSLFFINPMCYGKIKRFETVVRLFSHSPNEFYQIYKQHPYLFEYKPPEIYEIDCSDLSQARINECSPEVLQFYEEHIIKPMINLIHSKYGAQVLIKALINNYTPAEIILRNFSYDIVVSSLQERYISHAVVHFVRNLNKDFMDYLERNVARTLCCSEYTYFPGILLFCPSLSYEHKNLYKKSLNHLLLIAYKIFKRLEDYPEELQILIEIPEEVAKIFNSREAFYLLRKVLHLQKAYVNLHYKAFQRKAFMFVIKNPEHLKEFQDVTRAYQNLENRANAKAAALMFYRFCLENFKKYEKPQPVFREIYRTFINYGEELTAQLFGIFFDIAILEVPRSYQRLKKRIFEAKISAPPIDDVFAKYADVIVNALTAKKQVNMM